MNRHALEFLQVVRTHLGELESMSSARYDFLERSARAERALAAARRALSAIETFVRAPATGAESQRS